MALASAFSSVSSYDAAGKVKGEATAKTACIYRYTLVKSTWKLSESRLDSAMALLAVD